MQPLEWPFRGTEALAAGAVTPHRLRTEFEMVHRNVYIPRGKKLTPVTRAIAAWLWSGRSATLAGLSAAALHRTAWIDHWLPAELNRRSREQGARHHIAQRHPRRRRNVCARRHPPDHTGTHGVRLGQAKGLTTAVIRLDALMHATELKPTDVEVLNDRHRGARGLVQLRQALLVADGGAESPFQTKTRLVLIGSGLPRPHTQIEVLNDRGAVLARVDMGWEDWKVGVEFDGAQHWTDPAQRTWDIDRLAELEARGWTIIRVSADMLRHRPHVVVARARSALLAAG